VPRLRRLVRTASLFLLCLAGGFAWGLITLHVGFMNLLLLTALIVLGLNVGTLGGQVERLERQVRRLRDDRVNAACAGAARDGDDYDTLLRFRDLEDRLDGHDDRLDAVEREAAIVDHRLSQRTAYGLISRIAGN